MREVDRLRRFLFEKAPLRGHWLRLEDAWQAAREHQLDHPPAVTALLGEALTEEQKRECFDSLFRYYDLSNEQAYLRQKSRIRAETWVFWSDGMRSNFKKPAFHWAWKEIEQSGTQDFNEFRQLVQSDFKDDPRAWGRTACCAR